MHMNAVAIAWVLASVAAIGTASAVPPVATKHVSRSFDECNVNICWAFDGSGSISPAAFSAQKAFANRVGSIINFGFTPSKMGAVQYATVVRPVQSLTGNDAVFLRAIDRMQQLGGATNIDGGIFGCRFTLDGTDDQARHIIVLTDGSASIGDPGFDQAESFREAGGLVSIVAAGNPNQAALEQLAGSSGKVFNVNSFTDDLEMVRISQQLGQRVCSGSS